MKLTKYLPVLLLGAMAGLSVRSVYAHAFGGRYDLPLPLGFFLFGGAAAVALSFVVIGMFVKQRPGTSGYATLNLLSVPVLGTVLSSRVTAFLLKLLSLAIFALILAASFFGTNAELENFSPIFVWIIWWVGMGYVSALIGNLWMFFNPWRISFEWVSAIFGRSRRGERGLLKYPEHLDVWPALALFFAFAWLENVFIGSARPSTLGLLIVTYSIITWAGMVLFGKHTWLRHGEAFSVLFGFFARFSPTEVRVTNRSVCSECSGYCNVAESGCIDCYECYEAAPPSERALNLRPFAVGLSNPERVTTATAVFVVFALATVTFDGLKETSAWLSLQNSLYSAVSVFGSRVLEVIDTLGLLIIPAIFLTVYYLFSWAIRAMSHDPGDVASVARGFVFALVPIALAYNMAHYFSLLLIQGQLIVARLSDPFGFGWDLLGTGGYVIDVGVVTATTVWYVALGAIVAGHILSVYIAHVIALRRVPDHKAALRGQIPMLALMVLYTFTSLWIIAQPIVQG